MVLKVLTTSVLRSTVSCFRMGLHAWSIAALALVQLAIGLPVVVYDEDFARHKMVKLAAASYVDDVQRCLDDQNVTAKVCLQCVQQPPQTCASGVQHLYSPMRHQRYLLRLHSRITSAQGNHSGVQVNSYVHANGEHIHALVQRVRRLLSNCARGQKVGIRQAAAILRHGNGWRLFL